MAQKKKDAETPVLTIERKMTVNAVKLRIVGEGPLVVHNFSDKARKQIAAGQDGKPKPKKKPARDPKAEYLAAFYRDTDGKACLPCVCLKQCIVVAGQRFYDATKVFLNGTIYIVGDTRTTDDQDAITIKYKKVAMHTATVRLSGINRTADLRYRPMFTGWSLDFHLQYDASRIELPAIMEFLKRAGFSVGLCEWRAERGGEWGYFHIEEAK